MPINADKPHQWKEDVAASVDMFNAWFMQAAPAAFRETRVKVTGEVEHSVDSEFALHHSSSSRCESRSNKVYSAGSTTRVNRVAERIPPITTVASGR